MRFQAACHGDLWRFRKANAPVDEEWGGGSMNIPVHRPLSAAFPQVATRKRSLRRRREDACRTCAAGAMAPFEPAFAPKARRRASAPAPKAPRCSSRQRRRRTGVRPALCGALVCRLRDRPFGPMGVRRSTPLRFRQRAQRHAVVHLADACRLEVGGGRSSRPAGAHQSGSTLDLWAAVPSRAFSKLNHPSIIEPIL